MNEEAGEKNNDKAALDKQQLEKGGKIWKDERLNHVSECLAVLQDAVEKLSEENKDLNQEVNTLRGQLAWFVKTNEERAEDVADGVLSQENKDRSGLDLGFDLEKSFLELHKKLDDIKKHLFDSPRKKTELNSENDTPSNADHRLKNADDKINAKTDALAFEDGMQAETEKVGSSQFVKNGKQSEDALLDLDDLEAAASSEDFKKMLLASLKDHKNQQQNRDKGVDKSENENKDSSIEQRAVEPSSFAHLGSRVEEDKKDETTFVEKKQASMGKKETEAQDSIAVAKSASVPIADKKQRFPQNQEVPFQIKDEDSLDGKENTNDSHSNEKLQKEEFTVKTDSTANDRADVAAVGKNKTSDLLEEQESEDSDSPAWLKNEDWEDPFSEKNSQMDDDEFMKSFRP